MGRVPADGRLWRMTVGEPEDVCQSPAALVAELCALVGAAEVQRWCMDVLSGRAACDDPDRPSIAWLGGGPAAMPCSRAIWRREGRTTQRLFVAARSAACPGGLQRTSPALGRAVVSGLPGPADGLLPAVAQSLPEGVDPGAAEIVERQRAPRHGHRQRLARSCYLLPISPGPLLVGRHQPQPIETARRN